MAGGLLKIIAEHIDSCDETGIPLDPCMAVIGNSIKSRVGYINAQRELYGIKIREHQYAEELAEQETEAVYGTHEQRNPEGN